MKIEMHCHTHHSRCSNMSVKKVLETAKKKGLNGICITDHNCFKGIIEAEKMNEDPNFKIIKGTEFSTKLGDLIGVFLKKEIKYNKNNQSVKWLINEIHKQKGLVILPHPYSFFRRIKINYEQIKNLDIDVVEIYNGRNYFSFENKKCLEIAKVLGKPTVAGSDAHFHWEIGTYVIESDDLYNDIKKGKINIKYNKSIFRILVLFNLLYSGLIKQLRINLFK